MSFSAPQNSDLPGGDWRSDVLQAVVNVYDKEKRVLRAELNTQGELWPEMDIVSQLEGRIHDLVSVSHLVKLWEILVYNLSNNTLFYPPIICNI